MRILANHLDWLGPAVDELRAAHDLVVLDAPAIRAAWSQPDEDWWRRAVPDGWVPDVAVFAAPEYEPLPPLVSALPCPVVLWVGDWYANWEGIARVADQAELVLADATGVAALRVAGFTDVAECCPWTWDPRRHRPDWEAAPQRDVGFIGRLDERLLRRRHAWIARLGQLPADVRVQICSRVPGDDAGYWMARSRISFDFSLTGDVTPRTFAAMASGSMAILNADAAEQAGRWFDLGRELVIYDDGDLEDVVAHYLRHEDERRAVARAGWERVQQHGPHQRVDDLLAHLENVAGLGRRRVSIFTGRRDSARQAGQSAAHALTAAALPATLVELAGYEQALDRARADAPADGTLHLAKAVLYVTLAATGSDQGPEALMWAGQHVEHAALADPHDATAALARAQLMHLIGDDAIAGAMAHQLKVEILARRMTARTDGPPLLDSDDWRAARQEALLLEDDPEPELSRLVLVQTLLLSAATAVTAEETANHLAAALAASAGDPWIRLSTALALLVVDPPTALIHTRRVVEDLPIEATGWNAHARALVACGRSDEAAAFVASCVALAARVDVPPRLMQRLREAVPQLAPAA